MDKFTPRDELSGGAQIARVTIPTIIGQRIARRDGSGDMLFDGIRAESVIFSVYITAAHSAQEITCTFGDSDSGAAAVESIRLALAAYDPLVEINDGRLVIKLRSDQVTSLSVIYSSAAPALGLHTVPHPLSMSVVGDYVTAPTTRGEDGIGSYVVPFEDRTSTSINRAVDAVARNTVDLDVRARYPRRVRTAVRFEVGAAKVAGELSTVLGLRADSGTRLQPLRAVRAIGGQAVWVAGDPLALRANGLTAIPHESLRGTITRAMENVAKTSATLARAFIRVRESASLQLAHVPSRLVYGITDSDGADITDAGRKLHGLHQQGDAVFLVSSAITAGVITPENICADIDPTSATALAPRIATYAGTALAPLVLVDRERVWSAHVTDPHTLIVRYSGAFAEQPLLNDLARGGELAALTSQGVFRVRDVRADGRVSVEQWPGSLDDFYLLPEDGSVDPIRGTVQQLDAGVDVTGMFLIGRTVPALPALTIMLHIPEVSETTVHLIMENDPQHAHIEGMYAKTEDWLHKSVRSAVGESPLARESIERTYRSPRRTSFRLHETGAGANSRITLLPRMRNELATYAKVRSIQGIFRAKNLLALPAPGRYLQRFLDGAQIPTEYAEAIALVIANYTGEQTEWVRDYDPATLYHPDDAAVLNPRVLRDFYETLLRICPTSYTAQEAELVGWTGRVATFSTRLGDIDPADAGRTFSIVLPGSYPSSGVLISVEHSGARDVVLLLIHGALPAGGTGDLITLVPRVGYRTGAPAALYAPGQARRLARTTRRADTPAAVSAVRMTSADPLSASSLRLQQLDTAGTRLRNLRCGLIVDPDTNMVGVNSVSSQLPDHIERERTSAHEQNIVQAVELDYPVSLAETLRVLAHAGGELKLPNALLHKCAKMHSAAQQPVTFLSDPADERLFHDDVLNLHTDTATNTAVRRTNRADVCEPPTFVALRQQLYANQGQHRVIDGEELRQLHIDMLSDASDEEIVSFLRDALAGGALVSTETYSADAGSMDSELLQIANSGEDIVFTRPYRSETLCRVRDMIAQSTPASVPKDGDGLDRGEGPREGDDERDGALLPVVMQVSGQVAVLANRIDAQVSDGKTLPIVATIEQSVWDLLPLSGVPCFPASALPEDLHVDMILVVDDDGSPTPYGIRVNLATQVSTVVEGLKPGAPVGQVWPIHLRIGTSIVPGIIAVIASTDSHIPRLPSVALSARGQLVGSDEDLQAFARYSGAAVLGTLDVDTVTARDDDRTTHRTVGRDTQHLYTVHSDRWREGSLRRSSGYEFSIIPTTAEAGLRDAAISVHNNYGAKDSAGLRAMVRTIGRHESSTAIKVVSDASPARTPNDQIYGSIGPVNATSSRVHYRKLHSSALLATGTGPLITVGPDQITSEALLGQLNCIRTVSNLGLWVAAGKGDDTVVTRAGLDNVSVLDEQTRIAAYISGVVAIRGVLSLSGSAAGGRNWYHNMGETGTIGGVQGHANPIIAPRAAPGYATRLGNTHLQQGDVYGMHADTSSSTRVFNESGGGVLSDTEQVEFLPPPSGVLDLHRYLPAQPQQLGERVVILRQMDHLDEGAGTLAMRDDIPFVKDEALGYTARNGSPRSGLLRFAYIRPTYVGNDAVTSDAIVLHYALPYFDYADAIIGRSVELEITIQWPVAEYSSSGSVIVSPGASLGSYKYETRTRRFYGVISDIRRYATTAMVVLTPTGILFWETDNDLMAATAPTPPLAVAINPYHAAGVRHAAVNALEFSACAAPGALNVFGGQVDVTTALYVHGREWILNAYRASVSDRLDVVNSTGQSGITLHADDGLAPRGHIDAPSGLYSNGQRIDQPLRVATAAFSLMLRAPFTPDISERPFLQATAADREACQRRNTPESSYDPSTLLPLLTAGYGYTPLRSVTSDAVPDLSINTLGLTAKIPHTARPFFAYVPLVLTLPQENYYNNLPLDMWVYGRVRIIGADGARYYGALVARVTTTLIYTELDALYMVPVFFDCVAETGQEAAIAAALANWREAEASSTVNTSDVSAAISLRLVGAYGVKLCPMRSTYFPSAADNPQTYDYASDYHRHLGHTQQDPMTPTERYRRTYLETPNPIVWADRSNSTYTQYFASGVLNYIPSTTLEYADPFDGFDTPVGLYGWETYRAGTLSEYADGLHFVINLSERRRVLRSKVFGWWSFWDQTKDSVSDIQPILDDQSHPSYLHRAPQPAVMNYDDNQINAWEANQYAPANYPVHPGDIPVPTVRVTPVLRLAASGVTTELIEQLRWGYGPAPLLAGHCHGRYTEDIFKGFSQLARRTELDSYRLHDVDRSGRGLAATPYRAKTSYTDADIEDVAAMFEKQRWSIGLGGDFTIESIQVTPYEPFGLPLVDNQRPKSALLDITRRDYIGVLPAASIYIGNTSLTSPGHPPSSVETYVPPPAELTEAFGFVDTGTGVAPSTNLRNVIVTSADEFHAQDVSAQRYQNFTLVVDRDKLRTLLEAATEHGYTHTMNFSFLVHYRQLS